MEETIRALLALDGHSLRASRIAGDTVRIQVASAAGTVPLVELEIDVRLDPARRWYGFTTRLHESDGPSSSQRIHSGRLGYRAAGVFVSLDGVHSHEFNTDLVFDLIEQRLRSLEWRPQPGFWERLLGRA
jgi:hypothetical protein